MTKEEFAKLQVGDVVESISSGQKYLVADSYNGELILTKTFRASGHANWEKVEKKSDSASMSDAQALMVLEQFVGGRLVKNETLGRACTRAAEIIREYTGKVGQS